MRNPELEPGNKRHTQEATMKLIELKLIEMIKSLKNKIVVKILTIFFISSGIAVVIFFTINFFMQKKNNEKIVVKDLQTTVSLIYDTIDIHFSRSGEQWYKFKEYLQTGVIDPEIDATFNEMRYRILKIKILKRGYAFIINTRGDAVVHTEMEGKNIGNYDFIKKMIEKKNGVMEYDWKGEKKIVAFRYYAPF